MGEYTIIGLLTIASVYAVAGFFKAPVDVIAGVVHGALFVAYVTGLSLAALASGWTVTRKERNSGALELAYTLPCTAWEQVSYRFLKGVGDLSRWRPAVWEWPSC